MASSSEEGDENITSPRYDIEEDNSDEEPHIKKRKMSDWDKMCERDQSEYGGQYDDNYEDEGYAHLGGNSNDTESDEMINEKDEPTTKKFSHVDKGFRMLQQMGYTGGGLGKRGEGIVEPVATSAQEGRRGLGLKLEGLNKAELKWDPSLEVINLPEKMYWLKNETNDLDQLSLDDLAQLIVLDKKKETIDDETLFCDPEILKNVLSSKNVFNDLEDYKMRDARARSNPFETIKGNIFLNRAAVKMANMDSLCNFMFTKPVDENGKSLVRDDDLLYFADICAGPGGFSEYVLYRKEWEAKGFGFTLKASNDFRLGDFYAGPPETFDTFYGDCGDGDIYNPDNQVSFKNYVMKHTDDCGVHFVMADGGFSVKDKENIQEILSKQLYLCQCLVALSILRIKGHFVVKLFDLFTPFSVGLVYLMYKCFEEICICKPNSSRPANSERYLICKWRKPHTDIVERHLFYINKEMFENHDMKTDVRELIRYDELSKDEKFINYIIESNNRIGHNQIIGLIKIAAFCKNPELKETRQQEFKQRCLKLWDLKDQIRTKPQQQLQCDILLTELLQDWSSDKQFLTKPPIDLKSYSSLKHIKSIYDWYFVPVGREETEKNYKTFFLSHGKNNIYRLNTSGNWQSIPDLNLEISPKTLLYGEIITELIGEGKSQNKINSLHIIDALSLGGRDIRRFSLDARNKMCQKFAKALNKPYKIIEYNNTQQPYAPIRCKKLFALTEFHTFFESMRKYRLKDNNFRLGYRIRTVDDSKIPRFFVPGGLLFFNKTNIQYSCQISKTTGHFYYYNLSNGQSHYISAYPNPNEFFGSFRSSFLYRLLWKWVNVTQVDDDVNETVKDPHLLYKVDISHFIHEFLTR